MATSQTPIRSLKIFATCCWCTRVKSFLYLSFVFPILLNGCQLRSDHSQRLSRTDKSQLFVAISAAPSSLDPRFATDATAMRMCNLLFNSLIRVNSNLEVVAEEARSWTYKDSVYEFTLGQDLFFANGRQVSKDDLLFSFEQFLGSGSPFARSFETNKHFEVLDHGRQWLIRLHLQRYTAPLLRDLARIKILPKRDLLSVGGEFARAPMGSGPYLLKAFSTSEVAMNRNPHYKLTTPKMPNIVFKVVRDDNTRLLKMLKGEVDLEQQELPPQKLAQFKGNPNFKIFRLPGLSVTYLLLNLEDEALKLKSVRQAMSFAINRQEIITYKYDGLALPAVSLLTPALRFFDRNLRPDPFNPEKARALLRSLKLNDREFVIKTSNTPVAVENGKVIAAEWRDVGIRARLQSNEWGTFYSDVQHGNFQIAIMKWVGTLDPDLYRLVFDSKAKPPEGRNRAHYRNLALDPLLAQGTSIADEQARIAHYLTIQEMVARDIPFIPLWYEEETAVVSKRVKGFQPSSLGDYFPLSETEKDD